MSSGSNASVTSSINNTATALGDVAGDHHPLRSEAVADRAREGAQQSRREVADQQKQRNAQRLTRRLSQMQQQDHQQKRVTQVGARPRTPQRSISGTGQPQPQPPRSAAAAVVRTRP